MNAPIRLALDGPPNTNHTGFYVAQANGYYTDGNIDVQLSYPNQDRYPILSVNRVVQGRAELGITSTESVIGYYLNDVPLMAIATLLARNASAIITLKQSGINRPAKLDGKVYASTDTLFEDDLIRQLVRNDGGRGNIVVHTTPQFNNWQKVLTGEADATWVFLPWEGVDADLKDVQLNTFVLDEFEIPYGYNPLLVVHKDWMDTNIDVLNRFMQATRKGFLFAIEHPDQAARLLIETANHPALTNHALVEASQQQLTDYYTDGSHCWGIMQPDVWRYFTNWLIRHRMLATNDGEIV